MSQGSGLENLCDYRDIIGELIIMGFNLLQVLSIGFPSRAEELNNSQLFSNFSFVWKAIHVKNKSS